MPADRITCTSLMADVATSTRSILFPPCLLLCVKDERAVIHHHGERFVGQSTAFVIVSPHATIAKRDNFSPTKTKRSLEIQIFSIQSWQSVSTVPTDVLSDPHVPKTVCPQKHSCPYLVVQRAQVSMAYILCLLKWNDESVKELKLKAWKTKGSFLKVSSFMSERCNRMDEQTIRSISR